MALVVDRTIYKVCFFDEDETGVPSGVVLVASESDDNDAILALAIERYNEIHRCYGREAVIGAYVIEALC